jgi:hypothetical protein
MNTQWSVRQAVGLLSAGVDLLVTYCIHTASAAYPSRCPVGMQLSFPGSKPADL